MIDSPRRARGPPVDFGDKPLTNQTGTLLRRHMAGFYSAVDKLVDMAAPTSRVIPFAVAVRRGPSKHGLDTLA